MKWQLENFDERQLQEIAFNRIYFQQFGHGTGDHNLRIICAKMANLLDRAEKTIEELMEGGKGQE